jgi:hypothetical protein
MPAVRIFSDVSVLGHPDFLFFYCYWRVFLLVSFFYVFTSMSVRLLLRGVANSTVFGRVLRRWSWHDRRLAELEGVLGLTVLSGQGLLSWAVKILTPENHLWQTSWKAWFPLQKIWVSRLKRSPPTKFGRITHVDHAVDMRHVVSWTVKIWWNTTLTTTKMNESMTRD